MKLGILGTGKIVREFLPWLAEHTPFTVQAICSTERSAELAQSLCGQYGVPQHTTNFLELLQWVDVVYIAVPNSRISLPVLPARGGCAFCCRSAVSRGRAGSVWHNACRRPHCDAAAAVH